MLLQKSARPGFWCHGRHSCIWESCVCLFFHLVKLISFFDREKPASWLGGEKEMMLWFGCQPPCPEPVAVGIASGGNTFVSALPASTSTAMNSKKSLASGNVWGTLGHHSVLSCCNCCRFHVVGELLLSLQKGADNLPTAASLHAQETLSRVRKVEVFFFFFLPHTVCRCIFSLVQLCYLDIGQSKKRSPYSPGRKWQA